MALVACDQCATEITPFSVRTRFCSSRCRQTWHNMRAPRRDAREARPAQRNWKLSEVQKDELVRRYQAGETSGDLGIAYGVAGNSIITLLRRRGVARRLVSEAGRRYALNQQAFSVLTDECAYWLGFLMADGSVVGNEIALVLATKDREHVEKFRAFLGAEHPLVTVRDYRGGRNGAARLSVRSRKIVNDLSRYGVVPNKTYLAEAKGGVENNPHFWRGVVDGDGSIALQSGYGRRNIAKLQLVGTKALMTQFLAFARSVSPDYRGSVLGPYPPTSISRISMIGRHAEAVIRRMYGASGEALTRKAERAAEIMKAHLLRPPLGHDLSGKIFGRLTVIGRTTAPADAADRCNRWECLCECGKRGAVRSTSLMTGHTTSCGCSINQRRSSWH